MQWKPSVLPNQEGLPAEEKARISFPARQFVRDLEGIIKAKHLMTRHQWISLLGALLRLASAAHVLWLCDVNKRVWEAIRHALASGEHPTAEEVSSRIVTSDGHYLTYGII